MSDTTSGNDNVQEIRRRLKQMTQPLVDSLDARLRDQVDRRVDERVEERVEEIVDDTLSARLAVIERAIADLDRAVRTLEERDTPSTD